MKKYNEGMINILELLPDEVRESVNRDRVEAALGVLSEKERAAVEMRMGIIGESGSSYKAIGEQLGMSAMGAMKLYKRAIKKMGERM